MNNWNEKAPAYGGTQGPGHTVLSKAGVKESYPKTPLVATLETNSGPRGICVTGQVARTLRALVDKGQVGVTALELSSWALRLSAYVHTLRKDHGVIISTISEPHEDGRHARYVLLSRVMITAGG